MNRSAGEMRAEVLKAARGAGAALGTAEDLAMASEWMTADALTELLNLFEADPAGLDDLVLATDARAACVAGPSRSGPLWTALVNAQDGAPKPRWPQDISAELSMRLATLAARTYVPESDASRQAGAGAGDIDND